MTIYSQIDEFMESSRRNTYVSDDILRVYIRKGHHLITNEMLDTFDVANISTIDPEHQGKGYFKAFMLYVESFKIPVFVECIHNPILVDMLAKNGYTIVHQYGDVHALKRFD